jgi:hypothetical protein
MSPVGTFETCRTGLAMSVDRGRDRGPRPQHQPYHTPELLHDMRSGGSVRSDMAKDAVRKARTSFVPSRAETQS